MENDERNNLMNNHYPASQKSVRNGRIELMRFVFAVIVACYHLGCSLKLPEEIFTHGYLAVEFFFLVSGYLFAKSLSGCSKDNKNEIIRKSLSFMGKKYTGFMFEYVVVIVMTIIAWVPYFKLSAGELAVKIINAIPTFLLIQMFGFKTADWFVPVWYVSAMLIVMFILTPVMLKSAKKYSLLIAPPLSMLLLGLVFTKCGCFNGSGEWADGLISYNLLRAFAEISLGCTMFYIVQSGKFNKLNEHLRGAAGLILFIPPVFYMLGDFDENMEPTMIVILFAATALCFSCKSAPALINNRFVYFLGKLSLPIFLCHSIARFYSLYFKTALGYYQLLAVFMIITLVLSSVCFILGGTLKKAAAYFLGKHKKSA